MAPWNVFQLPPLLLLIPSWAGSWMTVSQGLPCDSAGLWLFDVHVHVDGRTDGQTEKYFADTRLTRKQQ